MLHEGGLYLLDTAIGRDFRSVVADRHIPSITYLPILSNVDNSGTPAFFLRRKGLTFPL
jgi:hypothetical protein